MDENNLSEEEKRKKEEEISKRLQEIKNRLDKKKDDKEKVKKVEEKVKPSGEESNDDKKPLAYSKKDNADKKKVVPVKNSDDNNKKEIKEKEKQKTEPIKKPAEDKVSKEKEIEIKMAGEPTDEKNWSKNTLKESSDSVVKDSKENNVKAVKVKTGKKKKMEDKPTKESKSLFSRAKWIVAVILILLILGYTSWYLLSDSNGPGELVIEDPAPIEIFEDEEKKPEGKSKDEISEPSSDLKESEAKETSKKPEKMVESAAKEARNVQLSELDIPDKKKVETKKPTPQIAKASLQLPCFVMSYVSTSDENKAKRTVAELRGKGLSAGYYWIPDYTEGGPELYKVFVGPYPNRQSAHSDLDRIRKYNKDAYYHILE